MRTKADGDVQQQAMALKTSNKPAPLSQPPTVELKPEEALLSSYCNSIKTDKHDSPQDHYFEHGPLESLKYSFSENEPRWQFMIRLDPSIQNLSHAAFALSGVLLKYKLNFKLFHPARTNPAAGYDPVKDYTLTKPQSQAPTASDNPVRIDPQPKLIPLRQSSDNPLRKNQTIAFAETADLDLDTVNRYRVGQELRVEIGNEHFQYDAPTYKRIMLECIKALQDEGVKLGCLNAPIGSIDVPCEKGLPPVISYGYFKPLSESELDQRHSVFPKEEHNPEQGDDPLEGIKLTKEDFTGAGINVEAFVEDGKRRIAEQKKHIEDARRAIKAELKSFCDADNTRYNLLDTATLAARMPLLPGDKHQPYMDRAYIEKLSKLPADFYLFLEEEQRATCAEFESNPFAMAFLNTHLPQNIPPVHPAALATKDLKKMQILYLRLRHLEYEQKCLNATLLSNEGNLESVFKTLSTQIRLWQPNNIPLRQSIITLGEEMAMLPEAEQKSPLYMDIVNFLNNALPKQHRLQNVMSPDAAQDQSEEGRKATLRTQLKAIAVKLHGKGPTWGKVLGAVLIGGGILLGGLSIAALIPSLGLSSLPGFTLSTWMVATGAGFFGLTAAVGVGACVYSRDTGPSKTTQMIAAAV